MENLENYPLDFFTNFTVCPTRTLDNDYESKQIRFPKSKKKRIRKKWAKDMFNFKVLPSERFIVMGQIIYMGTNMWNQYNKMINKNKEALV